MRDSADRKPISCSLHKSKFCGREEEEYWQFATSHLGNTPNMWEKTPFLLNLQSIMVLISLTIPYKRLLFAHAIGRQSENLWEHAAIRRKPPILTTRPNTVNFSRYQFQQR